MSIRRRGASLVPVQSLGALNSCVDSGCCSVNCRKNNSRRDKQSFSFVFTSTWIVVVRLSASVAVDFRFMPMGRPNQEASFLHCNMHVHWVNSLCLLLCLVRLLGGLLIDVFLVVHQLDILFAPSFLQSIPSTNDSWSSRPVSVANATQLSKQATAEWQSQKFVWILLNALPHLQR